MSIKIVIDGPDQILYQWDKGQRLLLHGAEEGTRVDFAICGQNKAVSQYAYSEDGAVFCDIPDTLLMDPNHLHGYVYEIDGDRGETVREFMLPVIRRPMPEDYVAPEEVLTWHELEDRIEALEKAMENGGPGGDDGGSWWPGWFPGGNTALYVKTVNGVGPDENGNVQVPVGGGSISVTADGDALIITTSMSVTTDGDAIIIGGA